MPDTIHAPPITMRHPEIATPRSGQDVKSRNSSIKEGETMTGADLLSGLREVEYTLWWAMRDCQEADPATMTRLHASLSVSLDEIETHIGSIRAIVLSSPAGQREAG